MYKPLNVAFIWHMHQPFYKDLVTSEYVLPWVRLHAAKDYYDMVAILDNFPSIKQTFNLVPSLLEQMEEYVSGKAMDKHLKLTIKAPNDLEDHEKQFILHNFFMANWDTMVNPHKRYHELLLKRGRFVSEDDIKAVSKRFTDQEYMDLQVWFNLTWFGHIYKSQDPVVKTMFEKGRNFTKEDKDAVLEKQREVIGKVIPKYKELSARGQISISITPYYHPILPLIVDTNSAKESLPNISLPQTRFQHPEDAKYQIDEAVKYAEKLFGEKPCGMWPSEGSVSEEIIPLVADSGIRWIATDEEILSKSLGRNAGHGREISPAELFKPYRLVRDNKTVYIVFRDHNLSDLVGFVYSKWDPKDAACDFLAHLKNIKNSLPDDGKDYLVSIILDGENAWEYYRNNGWDFLSELYLKLSNDPDIHTTTVCDFIQKNPPTNDLHHLFAGSWINHNFRIWIGHEEDNNAWDCLSKARSALVVSGSKDERAWKELYIAEGSDWCWWYGDDHSSGNDDTFDMLFRKHLKNIYHLIGKSYPEYLDVPIKHTIKTKPTREPAYLVKPKLDGEVTNYYEWLTAGYYDIRRLKGAMHQAETVIKGIYWGFDLESFHVRLDVTVDLENHEPKDMSFGIAINDPVQYKIKTFFDFEKNVYRMNLFKSESDDCNFVKTCDSIAIKNIVELSIPFADIGANAGDRVSFVISVDRNDQELERWPRGGEVSFDVPSADYEERQWKV